MNIKEMVKSLVRDKERRGRIMKTLSFVDDERMVKLLYKANTGKKLNLSNPVTYNEKIQWYKLYYHNPLMTTCADKLLAKHYVTEHGLGRIVTPTLFEWDNAADVDFSALPEKCVIKVNHNSDGTIIWNDVLHKDEIVIRLRLKQMLENNAFWGSREWCYRDIIPKIFAEELLEPQSGQLIDWNVFCFNGVPKVVLCNTGLIDDKGSHSECARRAAFSVDFEYLELQTAFKQIPEGVIEKPDFFEEMLGYASMLSEPFPQVRVDFFQVDSQLRFGEMTFYSSSGFSEWKPTYWQYKMGEWFQLPKVLISTD